MNPENWGYDDMRLFYYSASYYYSDGSYWGEATDYTTPWSMAAQENINWYRKKTGTPASDEEIYEVIYSDNINLKEKQPANKFLQTLHQKEYKNLLKYISFARSCNLLNNYNDNDPWEKNTAFISKLKLKKFNEAIKQAEKSEDEEIKKRYSFLAIRLAYYGDQFAQIPDIYKKYFTNDANRNIIDYWALYFYSECLPEDSYSACLSAQVFVNAPDKRRITWYPVIKHSADSMLNFCKTPQEKAAIHLVKCVRNTGPALNEIKEYYKHTPDGAYFGFLVLREVNKLEDYILTPWYTAFSPALWHTRDTSDYHSHPITQRLTNDRKYANTLLQFLLQTDKSKVTDPGIIHAAEAHLMFLTRDYSGALNKLENIIPQEKNKERIEDLRRLQVLVDICSKLPATVELGKHYEIIAAENSQAQHRFLFALARELEMAGYTTDAALLYRKVNPDWYSKNPYDYQHFQNVYKSSSGKETLWLDFYDNYFFYLDAEYTTEQLDHLIEETGIYLQSDDKLKQWLVQDIEHDIDRLYDLAGTKYLREDKLEKALMQFNKINDTLWKSNNYPYKVYLNANPFYADFYSEHAPTVHDSIKYNKRTFIKTLLDYKTKAEDPENKDRDYFAFLTGTAYLNMTHHGNSWMMRRYYWSVHQNRTGLQDDREYFGAVNAKKYFVLAHKTAANKKFAALALRMAGRCEKHFINFEWLKNQNPWDYNWDDYEDKLFKANSYYKKLEKEFPDDYSELMSNCLSFTEYFEARKIRK
jgi:hypothetical protein